MTDPVRAEGGLAILSGNLAPLGSVVKQSGVSDKTIMNVAGIFAWDVDFILDIRQGDNYYVQFEEIWQDGEFVTDGEIIERAATTGG